MDAVVPSYKGFRFPVEIISHCVWLCHRFPLRVREVEEMMLERGVVVSHEGTVNLVGAVRGWKDRLTALELWRGGLVGTEKPSY